MVFCLILLGKDKNQTNFECNYVCPSSQIKCGHQAPDEISLRAHKAQCSKIRKKGNFLRYIADYLLSPKDFEINV